MHVVHLYDGHEKVYNGRGSVPDVVWNLSKETVASGHEVSVVERQWSGLDGRAEYEGVSFNRIDLWTGSDKTYEDIPYEMVTSLSGACHLLLDRTNFALAAYRTLRRLDPDVIHVHLPFAANVLVTVTPNLREKLVYTAHLGETEKRVVKPRLSPDVYLAKRAARTIALNPSMKEAFHSRGVPETQLRLIPNGVDTTQFDDVTERRRDAVQAEFNIDADVIFLFVGTVTPRKGIKDLITSASQVFPSEQEDAEIVIVGDTDMDVEYTKQVRDILTESGIEECVTFTGFISESKLEALYDAADVFVLPSYEEGSSMSVSEALAAELPVIGSDIDGIKQQIDHGTHGLLTEPGDVSTLANHMEYLLHHEDERDRMQEMVRQRGSELSWTSVSEDLICVYEEVSTR